MRANRTSLISFGVFILLVVGIWHWMHATKKGETIDVKTKSNSANQSTNAPSVPTIKTTTGNKSNPANDRLGGLTLDEFGEKAFSTKIDFYGKVVDQFGQPVPDVEVKFNAATSVTDQGGKNSATMGDKEGNIIISGLGGATLYVEVKKQGYYRTDRALGTFSYGTPSGQYPAPTKDKPFRFMLQKMGDTEPLIQNDSRSYEVLKNGTIVSVDLATGRVSSPGDVLVQAWTNDVVKNSRGHYDWRCRLSIPGGGLVERTDRFSFEAPEVGYRAFDEIIMSQDNPQWDKRIEKEYFIQLPNKTYARIKFSFTSAGSHFFRMESYLNPKSDSRNLEYDPSKKVNVPTSMGMGP